MLHRLHMSCSRCSILYSVFPCLCSSQPPARKSPSPTPVEPPVKESAPVPTSNQQTTPPEPQEKIKSPTPPSAPVSVYVALLQVGNLLINSQVGCSFKKLVFSYYFLSTCGFCVVMAMNNLFSSTCMYM